MYTVKFTSAFKKAYKLMKKRGADITLLDDVIEELRKGNELDENIKINEIVNNAHFYDRYAISISEVKGEAARLICSKAADELLTISNVDASFVISPLGDNMLNISARSLERINVQLIMEKLGGGGHHSMAAAQLSGVTPEEAFALLKEKIDEYLSNTTDAGG